MKKPYILITLITLLAMAQLPGIAQDWNIQTIDPSADIRETHIQLDNNSYPHVVYKVENGTYDFLSYGSWNGIAWEIESVPSSSNAYHAQFCLDQDNDPHIISFFDYSSSEYYSYARKNSSGDFISTNFTTDDGFNVISVYFRNGILEFIAEYAGFLYKHIYNSSNNNFTQINIGIIEAGTLFKSVIDDDGNVYFTYYSSSNIRFGFFDGTNVSSFLVAENGYYPSITLDNQDIPHISFYKTDTDDLIHAKLPAQAVKYLKSLKDKNVQTATNIEE